MTIVTIVTIVSVAQGHRHHIEVSQMTIANSRSRAQHSAMVAENITKNSKADDTVFPIVSHFRIGIHWRALCVVFVYLLM